MNILDLPRARLYTASFCGLLLERALSVLKRFEAGPETQTSLSRSEDSVSPEIRSIAYWDEYAPWYKLWLDHTDYHHGIKDLLAGIVRPGWRVLDIGGGSGVLAIPLIQSGCRVAIVEPSEAMRGFLGQELRDKKAAAEPVIALPWEDIDPADLAGFDLVLACNSLHLTRVGAARALQQILEARPGNVLVVSELEPPFTSGANGGSAYEVAGSDSFRAENSFHYHSVEEALRHLDLKDRHGQDHPPREDFVRSLVLKAGHYVKERWTTVRWLHLRRTGD